MKAAIEILEASLCTHQDIHRTSQRDSPLSHQVARNIREIEEALVVIRGSMGRRLSEMKTKDQISPPQTTDEWLKSYRELESKVDSAIARLVRNNMTIELTLKGYRRADSSYQPEPDIHDIEMVGSELWIKDKQ